MMGSGGADDGMRCQIMIQDKSVSKGDAFPFSKGRFPS